MRAARGARGLTQQDTAERAGVSAEFCARIERGKTLPSVPTLVRLADALGTAADSLVGRSRPQFAAHPSDTADEAPEMRRLVRRLRRAKPRTIRLLNLLASALEG